MNHPPLPHSKAPWILFRVNTHSGVRSVAQARGSPLQTALLAYLVQRDHEEIEAEVDSAQPLCQPIPKLSCGTPCAGPAPP